MKYYLQAYKIALVILCDKMNKQGMTALRSLSINRKKKKIEKAT